MQVIFELPSSPVVAPTPSRTLTKNEFRNLFTQAEKERIDELEVTLEASPDIPAPMKRALRTGYKDYYSATVLDKDDPAMLPMLSLYEALGYLAPGRKEEILA